MTSDALARLFPFTTIWGGFLLAIVLFRLQTYNSGVDQRKNALRNQLRDHIAKHPQLLSIIQHVGKRDVRKEECSLLAQIHPAYAEFAAEIYEIRVRYRRSTNIFMILLVAWWALCASELLCMIDLATSSESAILLGTLICVSGITLLFVNWTLRLNSGELSGSARIPCMETLSQELSKAHDVGRSTSQTTISAPGVDMRVGAADSD